EGMADQMKILVAYDGSECADAAVDDLQRAGLPANARITILSVFESWLPPPSVLEVLEHLDTEKECLALARRGAERLTPLGPGWEVKTECSAGAPATAIIE